jgi:glycosyltransferase involved in cell wall biosynthesis
VAPKLETLPRISVVMPVWNGEKYLAAAVDSILAQTLADFEFIVVDDGSTDGTAKILASYHDPRLRIFRREHAGIVVALNFGMAQARAAWIARQDADDISLPRRLEAQWQTLQLNSQAVLAHTDVKFIGEEIPAVQARFPRTRAFMALRLCYLCPIAHSTVLFKKETALAVGGYLPEERHAEDYSLWGRMLEHGEFVGLPERLLEFRIHPLSVSKQNLETQMALAKKIAARHCRNFMRLSDEDAQRAQAVLATPPRERQWADWWWFLTCCAPRLRWKSAETCGWLMWQTIKQALRWQTHSQACNMTGR